VNKPVDGETLGVRFSVRDGLLDLHLQSHQAGEVEEFFKARIKEFVRRDDVGPNFWILIHRMARMCWESSKNECLTNLDQDDAQLLYSVPQDANFEWVFKILNYVDRLALRKTEGSIVIADHFAKDVEDLHTS
jgi:hypothetical protein